MSVGCGRRVSDIKDILSLYKSNSLTGSDHNSSCLTSDLKNSPLDFSEFRRRCSTFKFHEWIGMPTELSPLICSSKGWQLEMNRMLKCNFCRASFTITLPKRSVELYEKRVHEYVKKLSSYHDDTCMWSKISSPESFLIGEPYELLRHEDQLLKNTSEINDSLHCLPVTIETKVLSCVERKKHIVVEFAQLHGFYLTAMMASLHGWQLGSQHKESLQLLLTCSICCKKLLISNQNAATECDLSNHMTWCPWIYCLPSQASDLTTRMLDFVISQVNQPLIGGHRSHLTTTSAYWIEKVKEWKNFFQNSLVCDEITHVAESSSK